jgi:predicted ATP-binding protein involved in virulence
METNTIISIKIEGLFELFDYNIQYPTTENVLIITGPNGFGKTQILNIIFNLFSRKFSFFNKLVFSKITVRLSNNIEIVINKINKQVDDNIENKKQDLQLTFIENSEIVESFNYSTEIVNSLREEFNFLPIRRFAPDKWIDMRTDQILDLDEVLNHYADHIPDTISKNLFRFASEKVNEILDSISIHLIQEQRLFKRIVNPDRNYRNEREQTVMKETIQMYANELKQQITDLIQQLFLKAQNLDSTYPNRLILEQNKISEGDYNKRFAKLTEKLGKLTKNGLYESPQKVLQYSAADSKALLIYLNDLDEKLSVFDVLLNKLELFTNILNERRFTYKSIMIDRESGFYFKTDNGKKLALNELSSGEQHEVVLLYELIFKTKPGIVVLIDEPEISLHISWQKEFLDDLLKIIKIQNFQVMIATHSPSIINDRWDLVYNLEKK